jgi:hypothetical protein
MSRLWIECDIAQANLRGGKLQALQYTRIIKKIVGEMKVRELLNFLEPILTRGANAAINQDQKDRFAILLFDSRAGFARLMENVPTAKVLASLKVDSIYDPTRLARLVSYMAGAQNANVLQTFLEFYQFQALLGSLDNLEKSCSELLEKEKIKPAETTANILEIRAHQIGTGHLRADSVAYEPCADSGRKERSPAFHILRLRK